MTRLIRIDDYPYGKPDFNRKHSEYVVGTVCKIFNDHGINYILGVIPEMINEHDIDFLKGVIGPTGKVVMHGFNHAFTKGVRWSEITTTWSEGGEFSGMSMDVCRIAHSINDGKLKHYFGDMYDPKHFIAPFNCYTQELLDALQEREVQFMHTCDKEYHGFGYAKLNHGRLTPVVSQYHKTYDYVNRVIDNLDNPSQITLHWMFDVKLKGWEQCYEHFANRVKRLREYSA
jgi:hypothetical protein